MRKWNVGWGVVSRCNMNCQFCYSKHRRHNSNDLNFNDWKKFVDENHKKIKSINYGTGENTLDKDWFKLILHIRRNYPEIRQALTTNGHLSESVKDSACMDAFVEAIDEVDVSLDFCDEAKHNAFRGQPNAYKWAIDTLQLCQRLNIPTTIVFLGSEKNMSPTNIDGLFSIAKKYNSILRLNMYRPTEGISEVSKEFIVSYDTFINAIMHISKNYNILAINDALFSSILTNKTIEDPSGDRSIRILSDGSITPSTYLIDKDYIIANIREDNVLDKLEQEKRMNQIVEKYIPEECAECVYAESCAGGVYDRRYLWHGTLIKKDPYCTKRYEKLNENPLPTSDESFESVHDGYLPTIFFKPKED